MKIVIVLIIVGLFILPTQKAEASYGPKRKLNTSPERALMAQAKNTTQDYKVKNRQQAAQMVKNKYRAKVVSIQFTKSDGRAGYKAKLLGNDGVVFYVFIDASSGQMKRR